MDINDTNSLFWWLIIGGAAFCLAASCNISSSAIAFLRGKSPQNTQKNRTLPPMTVSV